MLDFMNKHWVITFLISMLVIFIICKLFFGNVSSSSNVKNGSSTYSNYHKCEYYGCTNYASGTKYCSKHTTYNKCSYPGCNNRVSYSTAKYCMEHELLLNK